jgi:hypothetical protein
MATIITLTDEPHGIGPWWRVGPPDLPLSKHRFYIYSTRNELLVKLAVEILGDGKRWNKVEAQLPHVTWDEKTWRWVWDEDKHE